MTLLTRYFLLLLLGLNVVGIEQAHAQLCVSPNPGTCTFNAVAVNGGQVVTSLCVGQPVRFELCGGRTVPSTLLRYGVLPGVGTVFPGCAPPTPLPFVYTPTRTDVGMVTVSELAGLDVTNPTSVATYYIRTFRVYDNVAPTFSVAPCPSNSALVTVTDATYDSYTAQAVPGGAVQAVVRGQPTVVPVPNGATSVTVVGRYSATSTCESLPATQPIAPLLPSQTPLFTSLTLQGPLPGGAAALVVGQLPAGYLYTLQRADATVPSGFANVSNVAANSTSLALPTPAAGCYRLRRTDPCRRDSAFSAVLCTLSLSGRSSNNRNQLLLSDGGSAGATYTVARDGAAITGFTVIAGGLEDPNVECGTTYAYRVTATYPGGGISVSNPVSITTVSALPPAQPRVYASINQRNVVLLTPLLATGALPKGSSLHYSRTAGGKPVVDFGTVSSARPQRDSVALADLLAAPPCYSVRLTDICGNSSAESPATCPALLTATPADPAANGALLNWTPFTGPDPNRPAVYVLQRLDAAGNVLGAPVPVSGRSYPDLNPNLNQQRLRYRLQISGAGLPAGTFSYSNVAAVRRELQLTIPTAFTPNDDGLNDVLEVKGKYLQDYIFVVVDRNGQEVFRSTKRSETWDGTIRGHAPVPGAYVWRFWQDEEDGKAFTATGAVTLLK